MTDQLRQALDWLDDPMHEDTLTLRDEFQTAMAATRRWLSLQEADETTVEKVAEAMYSSVRTSFSSRPWVDLAEETKDIWKTHARAVLAAIVGEET